ncbi:RNA-dependent ATPase [Microbotryomycetes sp. JL201]|nr:RNA-dependent ATPase [Microbotryomycetes sp. JL201]
MSVAPNSTTTTPPLSDADKAAKKQAKRERKMAKKAAKEQEAAAAAASELSKPAASAAVTADDVTSSSKKRKADETEEERKARKAAKKAKKEARKAETKPDGDDDATEAHAAASLGAPASSPAEVQAFIKDNNISYEPETAAKQFAPVLSFANLPLDDGLRKGLAGFSKPTPIQSASFPITMAGRDVVGIAETGSGKTVAFGVPAISHILSLPSSSKANKNPISCLVVAPTRELAMQTHNNLAAVASNIPSVSSICIYGGVSKDDQKKQLRKQGPRIVVGTPGRILDLASEGALDLSHVSWLVLDEADRMLDKGFENDIREIIKKCMPSPTKPIGTAAANGQKPQARITCMFSATWPQSVRRLAADFMCHPIRITVGADELTANSRVEQVVHVLQDGREKERRLLGVLNEHGFTRSGKGRQGGGGSGADREKALVFALYKKEATRVTEFLQRNGYQVGCIQGDMSQEKRTQSLQDFKNGTVQLLVATDVAARGLDIPKVELVVNQTFPLTIEDYIHRIGRTGRAGRTGKSVTFFTEADKAHAGELIRVLKDGGHNVPEGLDQWGTTIKKATHSSYGAHYRDDIKGTAKKIKFD